MASFRWAEAWASVAVLVCVVGLVGPPARGDDAVAGGQSAATAGLVTGPDGAGVAGAEVFAATDPNPGPAGPVQRARTDAAGRFRIEPAGPTTDPAPTMLWAHRPGLGMARVAIPANRPDPAPSVHLSLAPLPAGAAATVQVVGPHGEPTAGVRVRPRLWFEGGLAPDSAWCGAVPPELADRLGAITDAEGRATFPEVAALHLAGVVVETPGAAGQQFGEWEPGRDARDRGVRLREVGTVTGEIRGEDDRPRAGWPVEVRTRAEGRVVGLARAITDHAGRFALDGVAAGPLEAHAEPSEAGDEVTARTGYRSLLLPGRTATLEVRTRPGLRVAGRVVDRATGAPITGARVALNGPDAPDRWVVSGHGGRLEAVLRSPTHRVHVAEAPPPYLVPLPEVGRRNRLAPNGLPPGELVLALDRGVMIRGSVAGRGVGLDPEAGLLGVRATWEERDVEGRSHRVRSVRIGVTTGGNFIAGPVPAGVPVTLAADLGPGGPAGPEVRVMADPDPMPVRLAAPDRAARTTLAGRVVGPDGNPVAGALVQFRVSRQAGPVGDRDGNRITVDGLDAVVTDSDGRFRHSVHLGLDPSDAWRWLAVVEGAGDAGLLTVGLAGPEGEVTFPSMVLVRADDGAIVVGRVEGSDGRGVSGASVRDLAGHRAITDDQGQFRLPRPGRDPKVPPVLVVEHADYRCSGLVIRGDSGGEGRPVVVTLARRDEPARAGRPVPAPPSVGGDLEAEIGRILTRNDPVMTASLVEHLAEARPERAAQLLRAGAIADRRVADGLRALTARHLAGDRGFDAAEPLLEAIETPEARAHARLAAVAASAHLPGDRRPALVERVERDARSIEDLRARVAALAEVASAWLDLGQIDRARGVLREAEAGADSLPSATGGAAAWSGLAPVLARIDPAGARGRLDALPDPRLADRGRLAAARALSRSDPAEAARFFREVRDRRLAGGSIAEVVHRIAHRDPGLARSLVDSARDRHPVEAAYALGMLAHALAPTDRAEAAVLLGVAFDRLAAAARAGRIALGPDRPIEPSHVASALLMAVEAVDPALVPEFAWRAIALHDARPSCGPAEPGRRGSIAILATLLHRYDPALALGLFDPSRLDPASFPPADLEPVLLASARLAPHLAERWAASARDHQLPLLVVALLPPRSTRAGFDVRHLLQLWIPGPTAAGP